MSVPSLSYVSRAAKERKWILHSAALAGITLLAFVLRLHKLGDWSLWLDEVISVHAAQNLPAASLDQPIYLALIRLSTDLFGTSDWSVRLAPALIGALSALIFYVPLSKILRPRVAALACLLLAISPWHIYWSQNARFYVLLLVFHTLALVSFYWGIEHDKPGYLLLSLVFLALGIRERQIAFFLMPITAAYVLGLWLLPFEKPPGLRPRNLALFFLPPLAGAIAVGAQYFQVPSTWLETFGRINTGPIWILSGVAYYLTLPVMCMAAVGAFHLLRRWDRPGLMLSLGAVIPLVAIMGVSMFQYAANRYVFLSSVCWIALAAVAAVRLLAQAPKHGTVLAWGALAVMLAVPLGEDALYFAYQYGNREDWKGAFEYVRTHRLEGDLIVAPDRTLGEYYLGEGVRALETVDLTCMENSAQRVWFMEDMTVRERFPTQHAWIEQHAQLQATMDVHVRARNFLMRVHFFQGSAQELRGHTNDQPVCWFESSP